MKITMLAASDCGKTCYMLGLYYTMAAQGRHGFNLYAEDEDQGLDMMEAYRAMRDERERPAANQKGDFAIYPFRLTYGQKTIARFEWVDYRGDDLNKTSSNASEERRDLIKHLLASDCVYLGVSGELLANDKLEDEDVAVMAGIAAMGKLMNDVQETRPKDAGPFPIVILVTKYDMCMHLDRKQVVKRVKSLFGSFFLKGWHVMICPVTMGEGIGKMMENRSMPVKPKFVHWPLSFAVRGWMYQEYLKAAAKADQSHEILKYQENAGWFKRFMEDIDKRTIALRAEEHRAAMQAAQEIEEHLKRLADEIKSGEIYLDGKREGGEPPEE